MQRTHTLTSIAIATALACAAPFALAQTPSAPQHPQSGAMTHTPPYQTSPASNESPQMIPSSAPQAQTGQAMMGQHDMTGTVEAISANNIVDVRTDDGVLRVHFPNAAKNLKKGDKIILHLSYTMDASSGM